MNKQVQHYLTASLRLTGDKKIRALRAAQNHLQSHEPNYINDFKSIQKMIIDANKLINLAE